MFIYTDIIKPKIVGDIEAQLLRTVEIKTDSSQPVLNYSKPNYSPLLINEFESIEISIINDVGNNVKFQSGKTILTLHFRKSNRKV